MDGAKEIAGIMANLREKEITEVVAKKVTVMKDFQKQVETDYANGTRKTIELPKADVLQFILEDGTMITVRPSGTEPKIKYYLYVKEDTKRKSRCFFKRIRRKFCKICRFFNLVIKNL